MTSYRLAFVIGRYFEFGGLQRDFLRIALRCSELKHEVVALTGAWDGQVPNHISIELVDTKALTNHGRNEKLERHLRQITDHRHFDCVVGFNKIAGLDVYYAGDPCLAEKLGIEKPAAVRRLPRYRSLLRQEAAVFSAAAHTRILLIAHDQRVCFMRQYGTPADRFDLLPPGIDRDRLEGAVLGAADATALRADIAIRPQDVMLLLVGSGFRTKGVDRAIAALARLPAPLRARCRLVIVGKGNCRPYVRQAKQLGLADLVRFTGPRDDVPRFYHAARFGAGGFLIHPARTENTGTTLLEAMVCGLPVLTTQNCGYAGHVEQADAGIVVGQPFEQAALSSALEKMIRSEQSADWSANARAYGARTDLYSMVDRATQVIVDMAQERRASAASATCQR